MADPRPRRADRLRPWRQPQGRRLRSGTAGSTGAAGRRRAGVRMSLHVVEPGLQSLIVDGGRPASRSLGVPVGGAADRLSLAMGNALVGNPPDSPALEVALRGPTLRADS